MQENVMVHYRKYIYLYVSVHKSIYSVIQVHKSPTKKKKKIWSLQPYEILSKTIRKEKGRERDAFLESKRGRRVNIWKLDEKSESKKKKIRAGASFHKEANEVTATQGIQRIWKWHFFTILQADDDDNSVTKESVANSINNGGMDIPPPSEYFCKTNKTTQYDIERHQQFWYRARPATSWLCHRECSAKVWCIL